MFLLIHFGQAEIYFQARILSPPCIYWTCLVPIRHNMSWKEKVTFENRETNILLFFIVLFLLPSPQTNVHLGSWGSRICSSFVSLENGLSTAEKGVILFHKTHFRSFDKRYSLRSTLYVWDASTQTSHPLGQFNPLILLNLPLGF